MEESLQSIQPIPQGGPESSCTLNSQPSVSSTEMNPQLESVLKLYIGQLTLQSKRQQKLAVKWAHQFLQVAVRVLTYIPLIFLAGESRFSRRFSDMKTHVVIPSSRLSEAIDTSRQLEIPLMVIVCDDRDPVQEEWVRRLIGEYELGHFINQSFVVYGILESELDARTKSIVESIPGPPGLHFLRFNIIKRMEQYCYIPISTIEQESLQTVIERLRQVRKSYYKKKQLDDQVLVLAQNSSDILQLTQVLKRQPQ